jgi:uncharacterized sporulation protein YeaH/YhbH (DUF444 family)
MVRIIDRRFDSKNKSAVNRQRFMRRFKARSARRWPTPSPVAPSRIWTTAKVSIPSKDLSEPQFHHGRGGIWERSSPAMTSSPPGTRSTARKAVGATDPARARPVRTAKGKTTLSSTSPARSSWTSSSRTWRSPTWSSTQLARIQEYKSQRAGFTNDGTPANINVVRSLRGALGRRLALGSPYQGRIRGIAAGDSTKLLETAPAKTSEDQCAAARGDSPRCARADRSASPSSTASTCATTTASRSPAPPPRR